MGKATVARSGRISKAVGRARNGDANITKAVFGVDPQPSVPANGIPAADSQGVPSAETGPSMAAFTREGNQELVPTIIASARGQKTYGPKTVSSVARTGGQVRVAPGQFGAWAQQR